MLANATGYEMNAIESVVIIRAALYLVLSVIVSIILFQLLKQRNLMRLANYGWNNWIVKTIAIISHVLIAILLLDEIGLLLNEWNVRAIVFELSRRFMGLPGVSQLIYLANFGLLVPATYTIS